MTGNTTTTVAGFKVRVTAIGETTRHSPSGIDYRVANAIDLATGRRDVVVAIYEHEARRIFDEWSETGA